MADKKLEQLLHERFKGAESIAELRERLRDVEEELHAVFAQELALFASSDESEANNSIT